MYLAGSAAMFGGGIVARAPRAVERDLAIPQGGHQAERRVLPERTGSGSDVSDVEVEIAVVEVVPG